MKKLGTAMMLVCLLILVGCASGSFFLVNSQESNTSTSMQMKYDKFDGYKTRNVKLGSPADIRVDIQTESGSLNLSITSLAGTSYYQGKDISTSTFSVHIDKPEEIIIKVEAKSHKGSYHLEWDEINN